MSAPDSQPTPRVTPADFAKLDELQQQAIEAGKRIDTIRNAAGLQPTPGPAPTAKPCCQWIGTPNCDHTVSGPTPAPAVPPAPDDAIPAEGWYRLSPALMRAITEPRERDLSVRACAALANADLRTLQAVREFLEREPDGLLRVRNCGPRIASFIKGRVAPSRPISSGDPAPETMIAPDWQQIDRWIADIGLSFTQDMSCGEAVSRRGVARAKIKEAFDGLASSLASAHASSVPTGKAGISKEPAPDDAPVSPDVPPAGPSSRPAPAAPTTDGEWQKAIADKISGWGVANAGYPGSSGETAPPGIDALIEAVDHTAQEYAVERVLGPGGAIEEVRLTEAKNAVRTEMARLVSSLREIEIARCGANEELAAVEAELAAAEAEVSRLRAEAASLNERLLDAYANNAEWQRNHEALRSSLSGIRDALIADVTAWNKEGRPHDCECRHWNGDRCECLQDRIRSLLDRAAPQEKTDG
jgi:hypothetical protein